MRLVIAGQCAQQRSCIKGSHSAIGGYDPRLEDNVITLATLVESAKKNSLTYNVIAPSTSRIAIPPFSCTPTNPDILFLLNFTTAQRSALLTAPSTLALLYTPTNEHFGIGPVEGMVCGLPILATNTGGPTESIIDHPEDERTGWLCPPDPQVWADALAEIIHLTADERRALNTRSGTRARELFGMKAMAKSLDIVLEEAVCMGPVPVLALQLLVMMVGIIGLLFALVIRRSILSLL
jgi:alpha-1,3/alpha-1,6-mannosyltransferase